MSSRLLGVALLALAVFVPARTASATGITFVESQIGVNFGCGSTPTSAPCQPVDGLSNQCPFCFTTTAGTGLIAFNQTFTVAPNTVTFTAQAQTSAGFLHASASASYSRPTGADSRFIYAGSIYRELLTVNSATLNGQTGTLDITFHLDGSIADSGSGNAFAYVGLQAGSVNNPELYGEEFFPFLSSFDGTVHLAVPIVYGREFLLSAALGAFAGSVNLCDTCPLGASPSIASGNGSGNALFFNTLELTGLTATSSSNQLARDASFASGSGTQYDANGVVLPEPGSMILLGTGLAIGVRARRRRRLSQS